MNALVCCAVLLSSIHAAPAEPLPPEQPAKRLARLSNRAEKSFRAGEYAMAEALLLQARDLDSSNSVVLYNLACAKALQGESARAMDWLEKATAAGYTDFIHMGLDPDLASLREQPRYLQLLQKKDEIQRKAAQKVLARLRSQFGKDYLYEVDDEFKLVFATNIDRPTLDALKHTLTAQARSLWRQIFVHKPDEYILVVVPSADDYRKLVPDRSVGGLYMDDSKTLIAQRLGQVMVHEFTHALHAGDRAPLAQEQPIWLCEGLASVWEAGHYEKDELVPADNVRLHFLQRAAAKDQLIPLARLLEMNQREFVRRANLAYGESGSLLIYLHEKGLLRKFYDSYKEDYARDATGRVALQEVTGMPLPQLEKEWKAWMVQRVPPPLQTGPDGPVIGARLGEATDGIKVTNLVAAGPAVRAGVQLGDVIIGVDGKEVRDYPSFAPILNQYLVGDEVTLRIRRDRAYLDIPVTLSKRSDPSNVPARPPAATRPAAGQLP